MASNQRSSPLSPALSHTGRGRSALTAVSPAPPFCSILPSEQGEGIHSGDEGIADPDSGQRGQAGNCERRATAQPGRLGNRIAGQQRSAAGRLPEAPLMIPAPTHVWLVVEPIDMRTGIDGLSQRIQNFPRLTIQVRDSAPDYNWL